MERTIIAEGKTKIILGTGDRFVHIKSKDDITAGDGARRDVIADKGKLATTTTVNCFQFLKSKGIPTHFIRQVDDRTFEAEQLEMIPLELVVRRIATGSFLKRHPEVPEGTILPYPVEFFFKDDANHDPQVVYDLVGERKIFFNPKKPNKEGFLSEESLFDANSWFERLRRLKSLASDTFKILEEAWAKQNVTLVDLKIECGLNKDGRLFVGDVIDNDSWRIWPKGDKTQMVDKQVYRELTSTTPEALGAIKKNYAWVAEQTEEFFS